MALLLTKFCVVVIFNAFHFTPHKIDQKKNFNGNYVREKRERNFLFGCHSQLTQNLLLYTSWRRGGSRTFSHYYKHIFAILITFHLHPLCVRIIGNYGRNHLATLLKYNRGKNPAFSVKSCLVRKNICIIIICTHISRWLFFTENKNKNIIFLEQPQN